MNFFHFFLFFLMSFVATLPVVYGRRGDSVQVINRLALFQGIMGPAGMMLGFFYLATSGGMQGWAGQAIYGVEALLGFLLTYGLLSRYVYHRNDLEAAMMTKRRLEVYQAPLGVLGIALCALWMAQALLV